MLIFYSNKDDAKSTEIPDDYYSLFPLSTIHEKSGLITNKNGLQVSFILSLGKPSEEMGAKIWSLFSQEVIDAATEQMDVVFFKKSYKNEDFHLLSISLSTIKGGKFAGQVKALDYNKIISVLAKKLAIFRDKIISEVGEEFGLEVVRNKEEIIKNIGFFWSGGARWEKVEEISEEEENTLANTFSSIKQGLEHRSFSKEQNLARFGYNITSLNKDSIKGSFNRLIALKMQFDNSILISTLSKGGENPSFNSKLNDKKEEEEKKVKEKKTIWQEIAFFILPQKKTASQKPKPKDNFIITKHVFFNFIDWSEIDPYFGDWSETKKIHEKEMQGLAMISEKTRYLWESLDALWKKPLYISVPGSALNRFLDQHKEVTYFVEKK